MASDAQAEVAYILKCFPRLSETFIANEIHLLESMGLKLRLFSMTRSEESAVHAVIARIKAPITYLPATTSLSGCNFLTWLYRNLPGFVTSHRRLLVRRPRAYLATLAAVFAMSWKYRSTALSMPRKIFFKEFLRAGEIAAHILEAGSVKHLHGHYCHGAATVTWLVSRLTGLPFSFTAHAKDIYKSDLNPGDLLRRKMQAARFVATCTAANHRHLAEVCPGYEALHTVYHGLDTEYFTPLPRPEKQVAPVILSVGRFVEKKGFEYLLAACAQLKAAGVNFSCWLVGPEGPYSERVRQTIDTLDVADIVSTYGAVTHEQLRHLYRHATVFVLPCLQVDNGDRDGIPNVLAEAMAMGVPVVSTAISGIPELIEDGTDGLLVPERNSLALAGAIRSLLESEELRNRLSGAARQTVCRKFDSRRTTTRLADLLTDAVQQTVAVPMDAVHE